MFGTVASALVSLFSSPKPGETCASPAEVVGNTLNNLFTSDDERLTHKEVLIRLHQAPQVAQQEINKLEAQSRSKYVAGWRPTIGYVCAASLAFVFIINPILQYITHSPGPEIPADLVMKLVYALLGLGGIRTIEKIKGKSK